MTAGAGGHDDRLERFLDGELEAGELDAFKAELAASPELRRQVELQRRIDATLVRIAPRGPIELPPEVYQRADSPRAVPGPWRRGLALAAVLALALGVGIWFAFFRPQQAPFRQPGEVYESLVRGGFEPMEVCTDEAAFLDWVQRRFSTSMVIPSSIDGVELLGWSYAPVLSSGRGTGVLLARVDGQEVIVLVDDAANARRLGDQNGLNVYSRRIAGLALYEVTPLDEPRLISRAYVPDG